MKEIQIETILNHNKMARMIEKMAEVNCSCTEDIEAIKKAAKNIIIDINCVEHVSSEMFKQSFNLLNLIDLYNQKTASCTEDISKVREIKFSDEYENLIGDKTL